MNDTIRRRIEVLQYKRRQVAASLILARVDDEICEPHHKPIDAGISLRLQHEFSAKLKEMRRQGLVHKREFPSVDCAVMAVGDCLKQMGPDVVFQIYSWDDSGFFAGPISAAFLGACLRIGVEGIAAVQPSLNAGVLLDVVVDDPLLGDFYEVEWW